MGLEEAVAARVQALRAQAEASGWHLRGSQAAVQDVEQTRAETGRREKGSGGQRTAAGRPHRTWRSAGHGRVLPEGPGS